MARRFSAWCDACAPARWRRRGYSSGHTAPDAPRRRRTHLVYRFQGCKTARRLAVMTPLRSARLLLVPAREEDLVAELAGHDALARSLGVSVPAEWPPEFYDDDAI